MNKLIVIKVDKGKALVIHKKNINTKEITKTM